MKAKFTVSFEPAIEFDQTDMTTEQAISEITESMYFPCEDTDNVVIVEQRKMPVKGSTTHTNLSIDLSGIKMTARVMGFDSMTDEEAIDVVRYYIDGEIEEGIRDVMECDDDD